MRLSKRGHIPTYLLLIIALALCTIALFAFGTFSKKTSTLSQDVTEMLLEADFSEQYILTLADTLVQDTLLSDAPSKETFMELASKHELALDSRGNFFGKIRSGEFVFEERGNEYYLEINGLFVSVSRNVNKVERTFSISKSYPLP